MKDSRWGKRIRGDGKTAEMIARLFKVSKAKFMKERDDFEFNLGAFRRDWKQQRLF